MNDALAGADKVTDAFGVAGAIIPVAGLSSRMGAFKPLLTLNGFPLIRMTVQCALDAGVPLVCVVTGREGEQVREALAGITEVTEIVDTEDVADATQATQAPKAPNSAASPPRKQQVICIENPDFATTDMLQSVKLGLRELLTYAEGVRADGSKPGPLTSVFILPGDVAAVHPRTLIHLLEQRMRTIVCQGDVSFDTHPPSTPSVPATATATAHPPQLCSYCIPTYEGKRGHPVLLSRECFDAVLSYEGDGGLREALAEFAELGAVTAQEVPVKDAGILLDADDPQAFDELSHYVRAHKGLSDDLVDELLDACETLPHIREHSKVVSALAVRMAQNLNNLDARGAFCARSSPDARDILDSSDPFDPLNARDLRSTLGQGLDTQLCRSAADLHDMLRLEPHHEQAAGQRLIDRGYDALANIVSIHNTFVEGEIAEFTESLIVCLADKLVKETTFVAPSQRYEPGLQKFPENTEVGKRIRRDLTICQKLLTCYETLTGDRIV